MHLSTEEPAASWMLELFGEVGGDVPISFSINDAVKGYREKIVLKTSQLELVTTPRTKTPRTKKLLI